MDAIQNIYDLFTRYGFGTGRVLVDLILIAAFISLLMKYIGWPIYDRFIAPAIKFCLDVHATHAKVEKILHEVQTNGGGSLKDTILLISKEVNNITHKINRVTYIQRVLLSFFGTLHQDSLGFYETDERGHCLFVTPKWSQITHISETEALGNGWINAIHLDDRDKVVTEFTHAVTQERSFSMVYRLSHDSKNVISDCYPLVIDKKIIGFIGAIRYYDENHHQKPIALS